MALALESHRSDRHNPYRKSAPAEFYPKVTPISRRRRGSVAVSRPRSQRAAQLLREPHSPKPTPVVPFQPAEQPTPAWVQWILSLQRGSSAIGLGLVGATLMVYGSTVYAQQRWNVASQELDRLRRDERELMQKTEVLKHQIAKQTESDDTGLIPQTPDQFLFLQPALLRPATDTNAPTSSSIPAPMGY